ncbi:hypothetical protein AB0M54_04900 [Actinoplanes sp. NPDC051470]|uniref:hypothetical protein n=1 Tax=Actinoplanes sp. NPDC051470 TaxID=3157224 RepID=UPI0034143D7C
MAARTMRRLHRTETPHTKWCTRDHRCGINEHRSADFIADALGGRAVITRVRAGDTDYAEIRARIPLHSNENGARWQLATALRLMRDLLDTVAIRPGALRSRTERPALRTARR